MRDVCGNSTAIATFVGHEFVPVNWAPWKHVAVADWTKSVTSNLRILTASSHIKDLTVLIGTPAYSHVIENMFYGFILASIVSAAPFLCNVHNRHIQCLPFVAEIRPLASFLAQWAMWQLQDTIARYGDLAQTRDMCRMPACHNHSLSWFVEYRTECATVAWIAQTTRWVFCFSLDSVT